MCKSVATLMWEIVGVDLLYASWVYKTRAQSKPGNPHFLIGFRNLSVMSWKMQVFSKDFESPTLCFWAKISKGLFDTFLGHSLDFNSADLIFRDLGDWIQGSDGQLIG